MLRLFRRPYKGQSALRVNSQQAYRVSRKGRAAPKGPNTACGRADRGRPSFTLYAGARQPEANLISGYGDRYNPSRPQQPFRFGSPVQGFTDRPWQGRK